MAGIRIVETICEAWRQKQPELLRGMLADEFKWYETPYSEAKTSTAELIKMWESDLAPQSEIKVDYKSLSDGDGQCIAHWSAEFVREGKTEILDGIFQIKYNNDHKLTEFRQWWVTKDSKDKES